MSSSYNKTQIFTGYSGQSGAMGTSGTSGVFGLNNSGLSGYSGRSGSQGISGLNGSSGYSGSSGLDGPNGLEGTSGYSGASGQSGVAGQDGASGYSGTSGPSGISGLDGISGYSGYRGSSGSSGLTLSGYSGQSGTSGYAGTGTSGYSGYSGPTGFTGTNGTSGASGVTVTGSSGASGAAGTAGVTGAGSGTSGTSGFAKSGTSGTSGVSGVSGVAAVGSGNVAQTNLKTTTGTISSSGLLNACYPLPGGEYGFYPQLYTSATLKNIHSANLNFNYTTTSYQSLIHFGATGQTDYATQRYVTASGQDYWIFLLTDKDTNSVMSSYAAPDHPAYGNGRDPNVVQHPFASSYDETKHVIIVVEKQTAETLRSEYKGDSFKISKSIYEDKIIGIDTTYVPLHSGKITYDENGNKILEMVEKLPSYIKCKTLVDKV